MAKVAPMLATVLGGPVAGGIAAVVASVFGTDHTPDAVLEAIKTDPDAAVKLAQIEANKALGLEEIISRVQIARLDAHARQQDAIGKTMQTEAHSEHWAQWSWRPFCGFSLGLLCLLTGVTVFAVYIGVIARGVPVDALQHVPGMLASMGVVIGALSAVVGVSAYQRGREKREKQMQGVPTLRDVIDTAN